MEISLPFTTVPEQPKKKILIQKHGPCKQEKHVNIYVWYVQFQLLALTVTFAAECQK